MATGAVTSSEKRMAEFRALSLDERSSFFTSHRGKVQQQILSELTDEEAAELLDHLDLHHAHRVIGQISSTRRRRRLISNLKKDIHNKIEDFLQFNLRATTSLVHLNYILVDTKTSVGDTAEIIEDHVHETGKIPVVLVSEKGKLKGEIAFSTLVRERNSNKLANYVKKLETIEYTATKKEVIEFFTKRPHKRAVLLDSDGSVLGVVYADDVLTLIEETPASALYNFAGVSEMETSLDSVRSKVRHRYKWLIFNLVTTFFAAATVGLFEDTLNQLVVLAMYMPVVAGMGGNAAAQTLAVVVRGLTIGELTPERSLPVILREVAAGITNGVISGVIVATIAIVWNGSIMLGVVLAAAMIVNLFVAGLFGAVVPLVMRSLGKDPATSATIFISTATDVFGFMAFLGLATLILL